MEVNNLPKQLKIAIGLELSGLFESPLFLYIGLSLLQAKSPATLLS